MDEEGDTTEVELGKYALTHRLGIQIRDLRLLDAQAASSPPAILCRDQAIVVNLEFIKCIITTRAPKSVVLLLPFRVGAAAVLVNGAFLLLAMIAKRGEYMNGML